MSYKIGSFNVRNLSYSSGSSRDLDYIADIIKQFDIIALQEVLSEGKILTGFSSDDPSVEAKAYEYSLKSRLGEHWDICWLDPQTNSKYYPYLGNDDRGEGYAFIWNTEKFKLPKDEKGQEIKPCIFRNYRTKKKTNELRLIRDPAYGRFQLVSDDIVEIRLITTHIVFGKPTEGNLSKDIDYGATTMRQNEFRILAREVYTKISDNHIDVHGITPYTIILGDYNLNLKASGAGSHYVPDVIAFDDQRNELASSQENSTYFICTEQTDLSTVNSDGNDYASNYDHFSYDKTKVKDIVISATPHRLDVIKNGNFEEYKKTVSDHIPIMVELDLRK